MVQIQNFGHNPSGWQLGIALPAGENLAPGGPSRYSITCAFLRVLGGPAHAWYRFGLQRPMGTVWKASKLHAQNRRTVLVHQELKVAQMLVVKCTNCDQGFKCEPSKAGEQVSCPKCHARVLVPFDAPDYDAKAARPPQPVIEKPTTPARIDSEKELMVRLAAIEEVLDKISLASRSIRFNSAVIAVIVTVSFVFGLIASVLIFFGALVSVAA